MVRIVSPLVPLAFAALLPALSAQVVPSPPEELLRGLIEPLPSSEGLSSALADLDGDGALELLTLHGSGYGLSVARGAGDFSFRAPEQFLAGRDARALLLVDIDADTQLDALVTDAHSRYATLLLGGRGTSFGATSQLLVATSDPPPFPGTWPELAFADLDGDGLPDLVIRNAEGVAVRLRLPDGGFAPMRVAAVNHNWVKGVFNPRMARPAIADFDGDGDLDVAVSRLSERDAVVVENRLVP